MTGVGSVTTHLRRHPAVGTRSAAGTRRRPGSPRLPVAAARRERCRPAGSWRDTMTCSPARRPLVISVMPFAVSPVVTRARLGRAVERSLRRDRHGRHAVRGRHRPRRDLHARRPGCRSRCRRSPWRRRRRRRCRPRTTTVTGYLATPELVSATAADLVTVPVAVAPVAGLAFGGAGRRCRLAPTAIRESAAAGEPATARETHHRPGSHRPTRRSTWSP